MVNIDNKLDAATLQQAASRSRSSGPTIARARGRSGPAWQTRLQRGDKVAILEGIPTAFNAQQRRLGFEDAMHEAGVEVVAVQSAHWEQDEANTVSAAMLREHPDLKAILASNDNMALGAAAAVRQAGKDGPGAGGRLRQHRGGAPAARGWRASSRRPISMPTASRSTASSSRLKILRGEAKPTDMQTPVDLIAGSPMKVPRYQRASRPGGGPGAAPRACSAL